MLLPNAKDSTVSERTVATPRDWKTASFSDVLGNEMIKHHLMRALSDHHLSHAYIFEGPQGIGKKTLASAFVKAVMCEAPVRTEGGSDACLQCKNCRLFMHGNHPDVKYIRKKEGAKSLQAQQIRDELVSDLSILPYEGSKKIYVIEEADAMTASAQNILLKSIEEPPAYVMILLLCENASSLLITVLSRCVKLSLAPLSSELLLNTLQGEGFSKQSAQAAASFAEGSLGKARALQNDEGFTSLRGELFNFLSMVPELSLLEVLKGSSLFSKVSSSTEMKGTGLDTALLLLSVWERDVLIYHMTGDASMLACPDYEDAIKHSASYYSTEKLIAISEAIRDIDTKLKVNVNTQLALDCLLISLK